MNDKQLQKRFGACWRTIKIDEMINEYFELKIEQCDKRIKELIELKKEIRKRNKQKEKTK